MHCMSKKLIITARVTRNDFLCRRKNGEEQTKHDYGFERLIGQKL